MALGIRIKCTNNARAVWEISGVKSRGHSAFGEQSEGQGFLGQSQGHGGIGGLNQG